VSFLNWIRRGSLVTLLLTQTACALLGYDGGSAGMSDDGEGLPTLGLPEHEASPNEVGDGGSTTMRTGDGSVTLPTQTTDAGGSESDDWDKDACGLSSWLPDLIPDLPVIPAIPGITVPCVSADAGTTTSRDAGARDAGSTADAGKEDAAAPEDRDAGSDAGHDAGTDGSVLDASSDAAAQDAAQDASSAVDDAGSVNSATDAAAQDAGDASTARE
jgi:hypothetical protein